MKRLPALAVIAVALAATSAASAAAWVPGTPYNASEKDVADLLERTFDHAYCIGVPRFGKWQISEYDYDAEYRVLDCRIETEGKYCSARVRVVKGTKRYYYRTRFVRWMHGGCA